MFYYNYSFFVYISEMQFYVHVGTYLSTFENKWVISVADSRSLGKLRVSENRHQLRIKSGEMFTGKQERKF